MPKSPSSLLDRLRVGVAPRYTVECHVADGGMGHVFRGADPRLRRAVAFKVLRPELATRTMAERFKREGQRLAALHAVPNIVQVYDADETPDGLLYLVMEFVNGPTLQKVLREEGALAPARVRSIGVQLLAALEGAHALGITHRDIKPANIFLRGKQALLGDFGIASAADSEETTLTKEGVRIGTLAYMSPEQLLADVAGPRSDLYSFGLVLRECLTGQVTTTQTRETTEAWEGVPRAFKPVLERALARDPAARWENAAAFGEALEEAVPPPRRRRLSRVVGASLAALGLAMAVVVALAFGDIIRAWVAAQVCRVVRLSSCPGLPRPNDLAISPFGGEGNDGGELARQVWLNLAGSTSIKLAPWDSLPAAPAPGSPPPRYSIRGTVARSNGMLSAAVEVFDSAGQPFERVQARADTGQMQQLAFALSDSIVRKWFPRYYADWQVLAFRPATRAVRDNFFKGKAAVQRGDWATGEKYFASALAQDSFFMPAKWELMIARRIQRKDYTADLQFIARHIDSLPGSYRRLAIASLTPDLRERFRLFKEEVLRSESGTAWLLYTNELFHRGALVGEPLQSTVDTLTFLAATEPDMNHSSTYDMAWWGELRLGRERRAWQDLERRQALGPPPGDTYRPFQQLGTWARFSPWKARVMHWFRLRSPDDATMGSLAKFARLGNLMDIPAEQLALGKILAQQGRDGRQRASGLIGEAGANLMLGRPGMAMLRLDSASDILDTREMRLQQREWPVHLAALGLFFDTARVNSARVWLDTARLEGNFRVRALYALGREAVSRGDSVRAGEAHAQLEVLGATSPSARRHAALLGAELVGGADPRAALDSSSVIYIRDTTLVHLSPFARASTYLERGEWQLRLGDPEAADREWLWHENSDFEGWPSGVPQEGEMDALLSVYARMLRGELRARRSDVEVACRHLKRVGELWKDVEPSMLPLKARAGRAAKVAGCH